MLTEIYQQRYTNKDEKITVRNTETELHYLISIWKKSILLKRTISIRVGVSEWRARARKRTREREQVRQRAHERET